MSAADYAVLVPLSEAPNGQLRTKDLGVALGWDRSRTSHQVTRMVKRGLVVREFCEDDARGSVVGLTPAGRAAIDKAAASAGFSPKSAVVEVWGVCADCSEASV